MRIDIWSDVACPWCYLGNRYLEIAAEELGVELDVHFRAFELSPDSPVTSSKTMPEILASKYAMSLEQVTTMEAQMTERAAAVGLEYHLLSVQPTNTFDAHRVAQLAETLGLGIEMAKALFDAYFTKNELLGDHETLVTLATSVGIDEQRVRSVLSSDEFADDVRADELEAQEAGFTGVPTMVVDGRFAIPGAQPPDVLVRLLSRVMENDRA